MGNSTQFYKDPEAAKDYEIAWTAWLAGDTIATSSWSATAGVTLGTASNTATAAKVWVAGGVVGQAYAVTNHIVTAAGREEDQTITIVCVEM